MFLLSKHRSILIQYRIESSKSHFAKYGTTVFQTRAKRKREPQPPNTHVGGTVITTETEHHTRGIDTATPLPPRIVSSRPCERRNAKNVTSLKIVVTPRESANEMRALSRLFVQYSTLLCCVLYCTVPRLYSNVSIYICMYM